MDPQQLKTIISNIVDEAMDVAKSKHENSEGDFDEAVKVFGPEFKTRLVKTALQFGLPERDGGKGLRGHLAKTSTPADSSKCIICTIEVENVRENKLVLAGMDMSGVNMYGSQMDIEEHAKAVEPQGELDLDGE